MLLLYTNAVVHYKLSLYLRVETDPEATDFGKLVNYLPFKHGVLLKFLRFQLALIEVNDLLQVDKVKVFWNRLASHICITPPRTCTLQIP